VRRLSLLLSSAAALGVLGLALGPGCRDATQVTVDITLGKRASCTETNGTAITVGTEPIMTEQRVTDEYVTATTSSCTEATHAIGTLVVTPGPDGGAAIIVVVAYDKSIVPSSCKPPLFKGCIVARRRFAFNEHRHVQLPITIDPDCKDVPCDAFSTCRTGKCFSSEVSCTGDVCGQPGDPGDGGTDFDAQVATDGGIDSPPTGDSGRDSAAASDAADASDSATASDADAAGDAAGGGGLGCFGGVLQCPDPTSCSGTLQACCGAPSGANAACMPGTPTCTLGLAHFCCGANDCPSGLCVQVVSGPLPAGPNVPPLPPLPKPMTPAGTCSP
jgi:hypothetical protein